MPKLVIATRNAHKVREIREILGGSFEVIDLSAFPDLPEVVETGNSFEENAILKALALSAKTGEMVLADDSGLEVDALGGEPGIRSARYAGEPGNDTRNREKLLAELKKIGAHGVERLARFRCVIAVVQNGVLIGTSEGVTEGRITDQARGDHGFGYDPIFVPEGQDRTFAELSAELKNRCSHRARAVASVLQLLRSRR